MSCGACDFVPCVILRCRAYNANKITADEVCRVLALAGGRGSNGETLSEEMLSKGNNTLASYSHLFIVVVAIVTEDYNSSNVFAGDEMMMGYVVREPIVRGIFAARQTHGKAAR